SLLLDEGKRIVLPAFFQRGRDSPDKTGQTLATAHAEVRHAAAGSGRGPVRGPDPLIGLPSRRCCNRPRAEVRRGSAPNDHPVCWLLPGLISCGLQCRPSATPQAEWLQPLTPVPSPLNPAPYLARFRLKLFLHKELNRDSIPRPTRITGPGN